MSWEANEHLREVLKRLPPLASCASDVCVACETMCVRLAAGGTLFVCGNGGSAADAEHIVGELLKGFLKARRLDGVQRARMMECGDREVGEYLAERLQHGIRAIALTGHVALSTAVQNDTAGDMVFAQQLFALGRPGDVFLGISCSGNARNVMLAAVVARRLDIATIGLSGRSGGRLRECSDVCIRVPADRIPLIQEYHVPVYHALCAMVEDFFYPERA